MSALFDELRKVCDERDALREQLAAQRHELAALLAEKREWLEQVERIAFCGCAQCQRARRR